MTSAPRHPPCLQQHQTHLVPLVKSRYTSKHIQKLHRAWSVAADCKACPTYCGTPVTYLYVLLYVGLLLHDAAADFALQPCYSILCRAGLPCQQCRRADSAVCARLSVHVQAMSVQLLCCCDNAASGMRAAAAAAAAAAGKHNSHRFVHSHVCVGVASSCCCCSPGGHASVHTSMDNDAHSICNQSR